MKKLLGIDLGGTKTAVCIGTQDGQIEASMRMPSLTEQGVSDWQKRLSALLDELLDAQGLTLKELAATGFAVPGPCSVKDGLLLNPPNMTNWGITPIRALVEEVVHIPVYMNNDANACALAEWMFGEFAGAQNLIYLTMSTGLGAGIVAGGQLIQGACDMAGEVGFHVLDLEGPQSPCGHRGSFEAYCGGKNTADQLAAAAAQHPDSRILHHAGGRPEAINFQAFTKAVREGDAWALERWDIFLERLTQGVGNLLMILNPEAIVMGTIAIHEEDLLLPALMERLPEFAEAPAIAACQIRPSKLGKKIGDLSALSVAIQARKD